MRVVEFCVGDRVKFRPDADVSEATLARTAKVDGYHEDPKGQPGERWLISVKVDAEPPYEQWVLPREIELLNPRGVRKHVDEDEWVGDD